jgi:membrane peptidoglycan carboxypeptidase
MLTRKIDAALDAMLACMIKAPALLDVYRPGTPERAAVAELLAALQRTDAVLFERPADPPRG